MRLSKSQNALVYFDASWVIYFYEEVTCFGLFLLCHSVCVLGFGNWERNRTAPTSNQFGWLNAYPNLRYFSSVSQLHSVNGINTEIV